MSKTKTHALAFFIYFAFFFALFLQYPLKNALWGNYDSWVTIIIWKSQLARAASFFSGEFLGTFFYPTQNVAFYSETLFGSTAAFGLLKLLGLNDLWACNMMIVLIFAGSAWGVYILAGNYVKDAWPAFFAGFAFSCSNLMLAVIDDTSLVFFMMPPLAMHFFLKYVRTADAKHLKWMAVLGGLQVFFSVYTFVLQTMMLCVLALVHIRTWCIKKKLRQIVFPVFWYCAIPAPLFAFYIYSSVHASVYFPWPTALVMDGTSLRFSSLFGVLPNNLVYPEAERTFIFWGHARMLAFLGFTVWFLAFFSLGKDLKKKAGLIAIALAGVAFSFVFKIIEAGGEVYHVPFYFTVDDSIFNFFRVPSRFFWLTSMCVSILAANGLWMLGKKIPSARTAKILVLAALCLHFVENTPFPLRACPYEPFGVIPSEYKEFFKDKTKEVIIDLPSTDIAIVPFEDKDLFPFNRELVYMNWQLAHRQHIVNGIGSYVPDFRVLLFERLIDKIFYEGHPKAFAELEKFGVTYVVFHKNLVLIKDRGLEERVKAMEFLKLEKETVNTCIFKVISH